jgi:hypothetical protein
MMATEQIQDMFVYTTYSGTDWIQLGEIDGGTGGDQSGRQYPYHQMETVCDWHQIMGENGRDLQDMFAYTNIVVLIGFN